MTKPDVVDRTFQGLETSEVSLFQQLLTGVVGEGVEIGCLDGFSTTVILGASELNLTSIDPFIGDSMEPSLIGNIDRFKANVAPFGERSRLIQDYSANAANGWKTPLDFLFIDGDHNKEMVLKDLLIWGTPLKRGGIIALHDSRMFRPGGAKFHPGPSEVARDFIYGMPMMWEIIGEAFSLTVARRIM